MPLPIVPIITWLGAGKLLYVGALAAEERLHTYLNSFIKNIEESNHTAERKEEWISWAEKIKEMIPKKESVKKTANYAKYEANELVVKRVKLVFAETKKLVGEYAKASGESVEKALENLMQEILQNKHIDAVTTFIKNALDDIVPPKGTESKDKNNKKEDL